MAKKPPRPRRSFTPEFKAEIVECCRSGDRSIGQVAKALTNAVTRRRPAAGVVFHSDRGCQYASAQYARLASRLGVTLSVGRTGQCWDNALAESFFATIKRELINTRAWPTRTGAHRAIFEYIESWYNLRRRHSALGYLSPASYETVHQFTAHVA
ncbi:transposase [Planosporangium thailandense]|uniref:Transposase n=1 Tax=Planosporangium thailandense TaxID=765197 RepID=A0ABX0XVG2_9ACTN|nr:integrase core domain-containing protein [Planosporangium thailandense]NJC70034.1 transposase [Planosporangium thailandense]